MKYLKGLLAGLLAVVVSATTANAWHIEGHVICPNSVVAGDVTITVTGTDCNGTAFSATTQTDSDGYYLIYLPGCAGTYEACLDTTTLPAGASLVGDACVPFELSESTQTVLTLDWSLTGTFCAQGVCWFTGGGALLDPLLGIPVADINAKPHSKTPDISFGGNVYPGCNPTSGGGGSWNHVDRRLQLHFHATDITVVTCGNVGGIPTGSTSPDTPFNFIEFEGVGTLAGIRGNKLLPNKQFVTFYARTEDHNEPGSKGANDGALIDRYYLQVKDGTGKIVIQVGTGNPATPTTPSTIATVPITDGNFQLHISSCDNPPTP